MTFNLDINPMTAPRRKTNDPYRYNEETRPL